MAGTFTSVRCFEESLHIGGICAPYCARPSRPCRGEIDNCHPGEYFLKGFQPSGPLHEGIEKFVAARLLTSHPVAVSGWDGRDDL
jgi:hypothetical protein